MADKNRLRTQKITFWWRWWDEAEHKSTPEKRLAFYDALMRYIFRGERPADPLEMAESTGADWAAYDATHYFDVIDASIGGSEGRRGAPIGNQNARKTNTETNQNNSEGIDFQSDEELKTKEEKQKTIPLRIKNKEIRNIYTLLFDKFWAAWPKECPRKIDRKKCLDKFSRDAEASGNPELFAEVVMAGLGRWKESELWKEDDGRYICAPLVWLNAERWNDSPKQAEGSAVKPRVGRRGVSEDDWQLCRERCANCTADGKGCAAGCALPPTALEIPMPPQKCNRFKPLARGRAG